MQQLKRWYLLIRISYRTIRSSATYVKVIDPPAAQVEVVVGPNAFYSAAVCSNSLWNCTVNLMVVMIKKWQLVAVLCYFPRAHASKYITLCRCRESAVHSGPNPRPDPSLHVRPDPDSDHAVGSSVYTASGRRAISVWSRLVLLQDPLMTIWKPHAKYGLDPLKTVAVA